MNYGNKKLQIKKNAWNKLKKKSKKKGFVMHMTKSLRKNKQKKSTMNF